MRAAERISLATVAAALLSGWPLTALNQDRTFLALGALLASLSFVIGAVMRRVGQREIVVRLAQLTPVVLIPLLVAEARQPVQMWSVSVDLLRVAFAPVPYDPGFSVMCALLIWIVFGLAETLAVALTSPAWTFPPLLLPYLLPCLIIFAEIDPALLIGPGIGYVLILGSATGAGSRRAGARAVVVTAATTAIALFGGIALALPVPPDSALADSSDSGPVRLSDPSLDLIRTLRQNSNQVLLRYRPSDGRGEYLRLTALPVLDAQGFHPAATPLVDLAPQNPGSDGTTKVNTRIEILGFASQYLPMPWFPVSADVPTNEWKRQPESQSILHRRGQGTRDLTYQADSARLPEAATKLNGLRAGQPGDDDQTIALPDALPPRVWELAQSLTRKQDSDGAKAQAIANYLRSPTFHYSTAGEPGTTMGTLEDFLFGGRTGYCVQFAGSMAILARAVGIPSRVVIGFLPGKQVGDHWEVTGQNMHAWTELYFAETGWLKVDATPGGSLVNPPPPETSPSQRPSPSPTPSATSASPTASPQAAPGPGVGGGPEIPGWLWPSAGAVLLLLAAPGLTRLLLRRRRLGATEPVAAVELAWREVRASVVDHGQTWPSGTPREVAAQLGSQLAGPDREMLFNLAAELDQVHFDQSPAPADGLAGRTEKLTEAFQRAWPRTLLQRWWPRSLRSFG